MTIFGHGWLTSGSLAWQFWWLVLWARIFIALFCLLLRRNMSKVQVGTPLLPRYTLSKTRFRLEFVSWEWGVLWSEETLNNLHNNNAQVAFILTGHVTDSVSECTWISQIKESRKNRKEQSCHLSRLYVKYRLKVMLVRIPSLSREPSKTFAEKACKIGCKSQFW